MSARWRANDTALGRHGGTVPTGRRDGGHTPAGALPVLATLAPRGDRVRWQVPKRPGRHVAPVAPPPSMVTRAPAQAGIASPSAPLVAGRQGSAEQTTSKVISLVLPAVTVTSCESS